MLVNGSIGRKGIQLPVRRLQHECRRREARARLGSDELLAADAVPSLGEVEERCATIEERIRQLTRPHPPIDATAAQAYPGG